MMEDEPIVYEPVKFHWFNHQQVDSKGSWVPFSLVDSQRLEDAYMNVGDRLDHREQEEVIVATEGRRFDVRLRERRCQAVYWEQLPTEVRRCSWFRQRDKEGSYVPYPEDISLILEEAYMIAVTLNEWPRRIGFPTGETVVLHNPKLMTHHLPSLSKDGQTPLPTFDPTRTRLVKRGLEDISVDIPAGEPDQVDHLVIMVHGIGPGCDIQMRGIVQCVNDFRSVSLNLLSTHFRNTEHTGRVEFLPVNWHRVLHGDATGVDKDIQRITLPSITRLRQFSNSTILDLFFYNSPTYCQTITDTVASEINRLQHLFRRRHPQFTGDVSLVGHSLGSLILFDLLTNQNKCHMDQEAEQSHVSRSCGQASSRSESFEDVLKNEGLEEFVKLFQKEQMDMESLVLCSEADLKELGIPLGPCKKIMSLMTRWRITEEGKTGTSLPVPDCGSFSPVGAGSQSRHPPGPSDGPSTTAVDYKYFDVGIGQVSIRYPQLAFRPQAFFALGSPIGMFLTVRGLRRIDPKYSLPTCKTFYNIYHPFDPVAYRIEPMVASPGTELPPVVVPHHKGRKRLHLEFRDSLTRVSSDLLLSFGALRSVWQTFTQVPSATLPPVAGGRDAASRPPEEAQDERVQTDAGSPVSSTERAESRNADVGMLNGGRRFDYVLQEKPIESFNEYLFALQSHLGYWDSPDIALLVLKEIYEGDILSKHIQKI